MSIIRNQFCNFRFFQIFFFRKHEKCSYFHNFGGIWLVNGIVLIFSAPIKYVKAQFNLIILLRVIVSTDAAQTTDRHFRKNCFCLTQRVSKRKDLMEIPKVIFHLKPVPFHTIRIYLKKH